MSCKSSEVLFIFDALTLYAIVVANSASLLPKIIVMEEKLPVSQPGPIIYHRKEKLFST